MSQFVELSITDPRQELLSKPPEFWKEQMRAHSLYIPLPASLKMDLRKVLLGGFMVGSQNRFGLLRVMERWSEPTFNSGIGMPRSPMDENPSDIDVLLTPESIEKIRAAGYLIKPSVRPATDTTKYIVATDQKVTLEIHPIPSTLNQGEIFRQALKYASCPAEAMIARIADPFYALLYLPFSGLELSGELISNGQYRSYVFSKSADRLSGSFFDPTTIIREEVGQLPPSKAVFFLTRRFLTGIARDPELYAALDIALAPWGEYQHLTKDAPPTSDQQQALQEKYSRLRVTPGTTLNERRTHNLLVTSGVWGVIT